MPLNESFRLGPFLVDAEGRLSPARPGDAPGFSVRWRGRSFHARLTGDAGDGGCLAIQSSLGRVPSSASDPSARAASLLAARGVLASLPEDWAPRLLADHRLCVLVERGVGLPITVTSLVTELAAFLVELAPYLDLMDDAGVG